MAGILPNHGKDLWTARNVQFPREIKSSFIILLLLFQTEHVAVYWAGATVGTLAAQLLYPTVRKMVYRPQEDRTKKSA